MRRPPTDDEVLAQLLAFYERSGLGAPQAQREAAAHLARLMTLWPGTEYGDLYPEDLGVLWRLARQQGARRLVLEVLEGEGGCVTVRVRERADAPAAPPNLTLS